jgi:hypothetical protein
VRDFMTLLTSLIFVFFSATSFAREAADPKYIVANVTQAAGGLDAAQKVHALEYRLHIKEATYEADGIYLVDREGRMRIDVYADGKRVFTECYDGKTGWEMDAAGVATKISDAGSAALWHGTQFPGQILDLSELPAHGHRISAVGRDKIDNADYDVLRLTMSDGFETYRYIDRSSHLITRGRDFRAPHPDIDPKKITLETVWSDFRSVDGVLRPFISTEFDLKSGKWIQTATANSIRSIPELASSIFLFGSPAPSIPQVQ